MPFLFALVLLTLTWTRAARADSPPVSWSITGPAACGADVQRVLDEMVLACAAAGGCRLAAPAETTDRRALITCDAEAWKIAARSDDGELWAMRLESGSFLCDEFGAVDVRVPRLCSRGSGDHGRIYVYDTGLSTPFAVTSPTDEPLTGVWGSSVDDVWIVGRRELILHGSVR